MYLIIKMLREGSDIKFNEILGYTEVESSARWYVKLNNKTRTQKEIDEHIEFSYMKVKKLK
jgi:hypothetical protein